MRKQRSRCRLNPTALITNMQIRIRMAQADLELVSGGLNNFSPCGAGTTAEQTRHPAASAGCHLFCRAGATRNGSPQGFRAAGLHGSSRSATLRAGLRRKEGIFLPDSSARLRSPRFAALISGNTLKSCPVTCGAWMRCRETRMWPFWLRVLAFGVGSIMSRLGALGQRRNKWQRR
jgi:hypothetical protein